MAERRPLVQGLKRYRVDAELEDGFVYGKKALQDRDKASPDSAPAVTPENEEQPVPPAPEPVPVLKEQQKPLPLGTSNRVPLTTRIRVEFATALKRASLERQLDGVEPNSLQDIVEAALEPWLRSGGYLK
jgi:hypothetical protein